MPIEGVGGGKPSSTPNEQAEGPINYSLKNTETTHSSSQVASLQQQPVNTSKIAFFSHLDQHFLCSLLFSTRVLKRLPHHQQMI